MTQEKFELTPEAFQEKRYEISKDILASVLTVEYLEKGVEFKRRVNLIFNCIMVSNNLMDELGYYMKAPKNEEGTSIRRLQDIFENKE